MKRYSHRHIALVTAIILLFSIKPFFTYAEGVNTLVLIDSVQLNDTIYRTDTAKVEVAPMRSPDELYKDCKQCHSVGQKLIGTDLSGVLERHKEDWLIKWVRSSKSLIDGGDAEAQKVYYDNEQVPMPDHEYTDEEIVALLKHIGALDRKLKANPNFLDNTESLQPASNYLLFILTAFLIFIPLIDLIFTRFVKFKPLHIVIILSGLLLMGKVINEEATQLGRSLGYEPDQPIKFSHRVHAGENEIACLYCHFGATESSHSGIPSASLCLNCHNVIRSGANTGEEEINKIHEAVQNNKPIEWVKVHNLPDYVFYSHAQHVNVGKLDCTECHGDVKNMGRIQQVSDLSMGWCLNCHKTKEVDMNNNYYFTYQQHKDFKSGKVSKVTVDDIGGGSCQKCHY